MIRAFIAVELPEALRQEVAAVQSDLEKSDADVKWVEPANLHLTLKFPGDIEEMKAVALQEALGSAVRGVAAFSIELEGLGAFPRLEHPRVLWVGIRSGHEQLIELASRVEKICAELGFPKEERSFSPHLTIGRVRSGNGLSSLIKKMESISFRASAPAPIDHLTLFQSTLSPTGPIYTPLAQIPFRGDR